MTRSPDITALIDALPDAPRAAMRTLRDLIHDTASSADIPVTEALKWGQPSFAPPKRLGTPVRLNWSEKAPERVDLLVHCQTPLISDWRTLFPEFTYSGSRALHLPVSGASASGLPNQDALRLILQNALSYRKSTSARP